MTGETLRLFNIAGGWTLGFNQSLKNGWEKLYSTRPTFDAPSLDESIAAGYGFVLDRACGTFLPDETRPVGGYWHTTGAPMTCDMRGPGAFARFNELPGGLAAFVSETRLRTDECRRRGKRSAAYVGMVRVTAILPGTPDDQIETMLRSWTGPFEAAGFDIMMMDAVVNTRQLPGEPTPSYRIADRLVSLGISFAHEGACRVYPTAYPWHDGRFGSVQAPVERNVAEANGYFNSSCYGTASERFLWLQGSVPVAERLSRQLHELNAGGNVVMEFAKTGLGYKS